jgi:hypothetical protein
VSGEKSGVLERGTADKLSAKTVKEIKKVNRKTKRVLKQLELK